MNGAWPRFKESNGEGHECSIRAMLLHEDPVAVSPVIVSQITHRKIALQTVEGLCAEILILHHQGDIWRSKTRLDGVEESGADATTSKGRIDAEIQHTSLSTISIADDAPHDALPGAGD